MWVNTPKSDKNYLTKKEKLAMKAILEKEVIEEDPIEIENQMIQECLGDDSGSDPDFVAKSTSDTDCSTYTDPESDQESNKKRNKTDKPMPPSKLLKTDSTFPMYSTSPTRFLIKNQKDTPKPSKVFLPLAKKLEIISLFEEGAKYSEIARDLSMPQSSVRTICDKKETYNAQAAVGNPSNKNAMIIKVRTRTMEKMEKLLLLWILDFDQRGIPVFSSAVQTKAVSLFQHIKENLEDKTKTEIKETFKGSKGWLYRYKKRHDLSCIQVNERPFKCKDCNKGFLIKKNMEIHEKQVHQKIKPSQRYTCNECETSYEQKEKMEWHINSVHLNKKPYDCNICEESFFIDSQLNQHLKKTHREKNVLE
jgi:hypothetical protein